MIKIQLTEEQVAELSDLQNQADEANKAGDPGAILGQVYPLDGSLICRFIPGDEVRKMYEVLGLEMP